jgi:WXG100 family type VII secretion target
VSVELSYAAFEKGIGDVRAACDLLETDVTGIDKRVRGFVDAGWSGLAADAFAEAWDEWKAAADDVHEALDGMGELLGAALRDFINQDDASQASLDALSTRLIERLG